VAAVHTRGSTHPTEPVTPVGLATRRKALGLTQSALGESLGVPRNTVARWERGDLRVARPEWLDMALSNLEAHTRGQPSDTSEAENPVILPASRLPAELSRFVGREDQVAECCALLLEKRLVTLTGAGGIGKSRLAIHVARCAEGKSPDGVYLVELAALENPSLVPHAVSTALRLAERAGDSTTDVLIQAIGSHKLLLVLDDCERVVGAAGELAYQLLRSAPHLAILATSREPLNVPGECAWRVPPLQAPTANASFDEIAHSESVQLFVERARSVVPWFKLDEDTAPRVAQVCRRLDGIPLALELAAARMKALGIEQLIDRLDDTFQLLSFGSRTAPSRQQTLRATIDWSYSLLDENERVLFRRLSVFAGGWALEAAESVTAGEPLQPGKTLHLLERLIDKSLVNTEERCGTLRQSMLDTLREYAHERLVEAGEEQQLRRRHFDCVQQAVKSIDLDDLSPEVVAVRGLEINNLRSALEWSIETAQTELALRLAVSAAMVWEYYGQFAEGICWLQRALALPGAEKLPRLRAHALKWIGALLYGQGDLNAARASLTEGCTQIAADDNERQSPSCAHLMGNVARASGDLVGALQLYKQAGAKYAAQGLRFWEEVTLFLTGSVLFELGDYAGSRAACQRCLTLGDGREIPWATARGRVVLAYLAAHDGHHVSAERFAQEALAQLRALAEPSGIAIALRALSQFALERGRLGNAWSYLVEALDIAAVEGDRMALARTLETLACVLAGLAPSQAAQIAGAAAQLRVRTGTAPWPTEQARLTRWLGLARRKMGTVAFEANWSLGHALSDAEAITAARGYVFEELAAPRTNGAGSPELSPLTARQQEVVALVARGLTNDQIAQELVISPATARAHVEHVLERLDLHSRAQVAAWATTHEHDLKPTAAVDGR
jgi:predicted ATPase/DNA-binding CsgD family transcriptional regulator